ncbi:hypothetical protein C6496_09480 [Candidatus Poribacteria bacterium]|nr:MAG: hypothetical protein C6496_09480 [Candidatus Poribacteria bacterium]
MKKIVVACLLAGFMICFATGCGRPITKTLTPVETTTKQDDMAFTVAFVDAAVEMYKTKGHDATISYYNDIKSVQGQWYIAILAIDGTIVANAFQQESIGKNAAQVGDTTTWLKISEASKSGQWASYQWVNFESGETELKHSWSMLYNGYIFLSGYYEGN